MALEHTGKMPVPRKTAFPDRDWRGKWAFAFASGAPSGIEWIPDTVTANAEQAKPPGLRNPLTGARP